MWSKYRKFTSDSSGDVTWQFQCKFPIHLWLIYLTSFLDESAAPTHFEVLNYRDDRQMTHLKAFSLYSVGAVFTSSKSTVNEQNGWCQKCTQVKLWCWQESHHCYNAPNPMPVLQSAVKTINYTGIKISKCPFFNMSSEHKAFSQLFFFFQMFHCNGCNTKMYVAKQLPK